MQPIHELLHQIRWDPNFTGEFEVAFVDRMQPELQRLPVRDMQLDSRARSFTFLDAQENRISVPLHRVRRVYRDGALIWSRDQPDEPRDRHWR
jgi:uncharacterized protein (UPF0248 family)